MDFDKKSDQANTVPRRRNPHDRLHYVHNATDYDGPNCALLRSYSAPKVTAVERVTSSTKKRRLAP